MAGNIKGLLGHTYLSLADYKFMKSCQADDVSRKFIRDKCSKRRKKNSRRKK